MEASELEWSERAVNDYENLAEYLYEHWGENIALKTLHEIDIQIRRIARNPGQFPLFIKDKEIRRCVVSPQTSIFFVRKIQRICLLSIFDNRQNPEKYPQ
ncbi:type II toxin-antitoxin system RelE/ParE family toxin [Dyadobacter sp. 32]|uniref:type II toxin-antitoxin system RelE/ParE family toxin n=1 Tax=Dyadobacter sp. 32 TaxID=538966 RepID=UPI0011F02C23